MHRGFLLLVAAPALLADIAQAQVRDTTGAPTGQVITGTVHDSLAGAPLRNATIQLVSRDQQRNVVRSGTSDERGRFTLQNVPAGRYEIGFLHPLLDSLGIMVPARGVTVEPGRPSQVDLAIPSPEKLRAAMCGTTTGAPATVAFGVVRDARDQMPVAGAVVTGRWLEIDFRREGITRRVEGTADTSAANGWFALCDVPRGGMMSLRAMHGSGSTASIDIAVPENGLVRTDLYLGAARTIALTPDARNQAGVADTAQPPTTILAGDGRLRGVVITEDRGRPLAGAHVGIAGGPHTVADERGAWTLSGIPTGTQVLEVRAVGYYPRRIPVDVIAGAPAVQVALGTLEAMLDTVRVTATRLRLHGTGFDQRRRSGMGRYLTSEDVLGRATMSTSDVFHTVPGMRVERTMLGETRVTVRGTFGRCIPAVYIDGHLMQNLSGDEIDAFVSPDEVAGIEVYTGAFVPPEFNPGMTGCGSIVIWTKMGESPVRHWSSRRRALHGLGAMVLGIAVGALLSGL